MSIAASIDVKLVKYSSRCVVQKEIVQILLDYGWSLNDNGKMTYLPVGDNGAFSWVSEDISTNFFMETLQKKEKLGENIGVNLTWKNTNVGGSFLFFDDNVLSVTLTINRKIFIRKNNLEVTDVNWYLERLLPPLNAEDLRIGHFAYEEHE